MDAAKLRSQEGGNFSRGGAIILEAEQVRPRAASKPHPRRAQRHRSTQFHAISKWDRLYVVVSIFVSFETREE
jgi:hypothetical protein